MRYEVIFKPAALKELAAIWTAAADRAAVSAAAHWVDRELARTPLALGESRESTLHRVVFRPPIGAEYEVILDDDLVLVQAVFPVG